jgi:phosphoribosylaminoimidazolecarboxamide formyltransferase/IMP cyclohydrolase
VRKLRYGENPHQEGALYRNGCRTDGGFPDGATSIHGKELSYNNYLDLDAAYRVLAEIGKGKTACTVIKHMIPCGAATAETAIDAFKQAHSGDPVSAFGSIVGFNIPLTEDLAREIATDDYYVEAILTPEVEEGVVEVFEEGPNWGDRVRIVPAEEIQLSGNEGNQVEVRTMSGGYLLQQRDHEGFPENVKVVSGSTDEQMERDLNFAWLVCKHVRSNAIVIAKNTTVMGVGAGQPSRVDAAEIAVEKAGEHAEGAVMASDAFFPFPDALEVGLDAGVRAAVQPGGSVNDDEVIDVARKRGITMVLTGQRHFKH